MMRGTALVRLRHALIQRGLRDDGVALMSVMLFMILLTGLSLVLLSVILGQLGPSFTAQKSTKTVYSAQAGLQAALGVVRSAAAAPVGGEVFGDPHSLPCTFTGNLDGSTSDVKYDVTIQYYLLDPTGKTEPWLSANDLPCSAPPAGVTGEPKFAYIVSKGSGVSAGTRSPTEGNRSVAAIYKFKITNVNVPGGRINNSGKTRCLAAETATVGSLIKFVTAANCTLANAEKQLWIYDTTYQIKLASTTVAGATPLCITGSGYDNAKLAACLTDNGRWNQLWSWNDGGQWQGQKETIADGYGSVCLVDASSVLTTAGCSGALIPELSVGAGAAGLNTHQIVNYKEFGRCADVTDRNIRQTKMITYPCKQDPSGGGRLSWNHRWYYAEPVPSVPPAAPVLFSTGQVWVFPDLPGGSPGAQNCLETPLDTAATKDVIFSASCSADSRQQWKRHKDSPDRLTSYTFKDTYGRCLTADPSNPHVETSGRAFSVMRMATCDGSEAQKWNAPATYSESEFEGFKEIG